MMIKRTALHAVLLSATLLGPAGATCLETRDIDHTDRPNDKTLLVTLRDRQVFRNDLPVRCPNLSTSVNGYTLEPTDPATGAICDGMAILHLNDQGHASCILGSFTRVK